MAISAANERRHHGKSRGPLDRIADAIEQSARPTSFEPDISGECFVGAFAGEGHDVSGRASGRGEQVNWFDLPQEDRAASN